MFVDPPSEVAATEFRSVMDEGHSKPILVGCHGFSGTANEIDWNDPSQYVVKLTRPHTGRDFRTRMACELIGAMLGKALGLNVPQYAVVHVSQGFVDSVPDDDAKQRLSRNVGMQFGTVYLENVDTWRPSPSDKPQTVFEQLTQILEYDSTLLNGDRTSNRSNLLIQGSHCIPIDHEDTLRVYRMDDTEYEAFLDEPLMDDGDLRNHAVYEELQPKEPAFGQVAKQWRDIPIREKLDSIRDHVPSHWESEEGDLERIFDFVHRRAEHLQAIIYQLHRVVR